jgi:PAS domain S-box-containing protein
VKKKESLFIHDIINKLSKIDGYVEMLKDQGTEKDDKVLKIERATKEAFELVNIYKNRIQSADELANCIESKQAVASIQGQSISKTGGWELDVQSKNFHFNSETFRTYGLNIGTPVSFIMGLNFFVEHDRSLLLNCFETAISQGVSFDNELEFIDAQGNHKWVRLIGAAFNNERGVVFKIAGTLQDITDKKEREIFEWLGNAEALTFKMALDKFAIVAKTDNQGNITYVNDYFCEISKYSRDELLGSNHRILNSGHHPKEFFEQMWSTISSGKPWRNQIKNHAKDGSYYWVDTTIAPILLDGKIIEYVAFRYDVTKEKRRQEISFQIAHLRARFLDISSNKKTLFDYLMRKILDLTESDSGFLGDIQHDLTKPSFKPFVSSDDSWSVEKINLLFGEAIEKGKPFFIESYLKQPIEHQFPVIGLPVYFSGQMIAMMGISKTNGSFREDIFEELSPLLDVFGEMIHAFNLQEDLNNQTKMALHNAKLASIGLLSASVGHEINNPLAIIKGFLSVAEGDLKQLGVKDPHIFGMFSKMELALERIEGIVKGLRSFSRSDENDLGDFYVCELVMETHSMLKELYAKEGVVLELNGLYEKVQIHGSRGRLQQVLVNLIANAKDATEGKPLRKVIVSAFVVSGVFELSVADNGCGLSEELKMKIFEPFFTTKDVNKGTGLGLSLVNTMVKELNGKIEIDSTLGLGSKFTLKIPIQLLKEALKDEISSPIKPTLQSQIHCSVLIVDDEEDLRDILSHILSRFGISVHQAHNGQIALDMVQNGSYDLIISDISMPVMDGFALLEALQHLKNIRLPKFIFMTGGVDVESEAIKSHASRIDGIFPKPFSKSTIFEKISQLFPDKIVSISPKS